MKNRNFQDIRYFALWDRRRSGWVHTSKDKCLWEKVGDLKQAFQYHTGLNFHKERRNYEIVEFELKRVKRTNKYFADLYAKEIKGNFNGAK